MHLRLASYGRKYRMQLKRKRSTAAADFLSTGGYRQTTAARTVCVGHVSVGRVSHVLDTTNQLA